MKKLTVIIPAGGPGGGMYPLTAGMPKSLIPVGSKPMLIQILEGLDPQVIGNIIIISDKYFPMIKDYVDAFSSSITIPITCKKLALTPPQQLIALQDELSDPFVIHYTDIITEHKIEWKRGYDKYLKLSKNDKNLLGLLYVTKSYPLAIGVVGKDPKNSEYIGRFFEKPAEVMGHFVNMAVAILSKDFIKHIKKDDITLFGESVPRAIAMGGKFTHLEHPDFKHFQRMGEWVDYQTEFYRQKR